MLLSFQKGYHKKIVSILVPLFLVIALPVLLLSAHQTTEDRQHASGFEDLNKGFTITHTNNPDGTMGPAIWEDNFSNSLTPEQQGTTTLLIAATTQGSNTMIPTQAGQEYIPNINSLIVTFTKVEVHLSQTLDKKRTDHWEILSMKSPTTVDLMQLSHGNVSLLGLTNLAAGMYTELRVYLANPSAVLTDGTKVVLTMPGRNNIIRITQPFMVFPGSNTNLTLDFDTQHSILVTGSTFILKPVISSFLINQAEPLTPTISLPMQK